MWPLPSETWLKPTAEKITNLPLTWTMTKIKRSLDMNNRGRHWEGSWRRRGQQMMWRWLHAFIMSALSTSPLSRVLPLLGNPTTEFHLYSWGPTNWRDPPPAVVIGWLRDLPRPPVTACCKSLRAGFSLVLADCISMYCMCIWMLYIF